MACARDKPSEPLLQQVPSSVLDIRCNLLPLREVGKVAQPQYKTWSDSDSSSLTYKTEAHTDLLEQQQHQQQQQQPCLGRVRISAAGVRRSRGGRAPRSGRSDCCSVLALRLPHLHKVGVIISAPRIEVPNFGLEIWDFLLAKSPKFGTSIGSTGLLGHCCSDNVFLTHSSSKSSNC